ncbi:hypothetical protein [Haladaptatus salinisoli]|uniref:hypothetical protein n=1 Tax=Haladaptatus salinisoli TaxID=2884876 RepID=UPI001D0B5EC4|nr:hypothetical protein [Haladaptatus salinisoli]
MSSTFDLSGATYRYRTPDGEESELDADTIRLSANFVVVSTNEDGDLTMAADPTTHERIVRVDDTEGVAV